MNKIKQAKNVKLKALALVFLTDVRGYEIDKFKQFFDKEFEGDYAKALSEIKADLEDKESEESIFKKKLENH